MSKTKIPDPFGYFCDWGDSNNGLQRIAMYYIEPGSAIYDDWNEYPKKHLNTPVFLQENLEQYSRDRLKEELEEIAVFLNMICDIDKQGECEEIAMDAMSHIRSVIKSMDNEND